jgi:hypothetical protein
MILLELVLDAECIRMHLWLCFICGAIAMFYLCVYGYDFFVGPLKCFLRLDYSLRHFADVLLQKTNSTMRKPFRWTVRRLQTTN